MINEVKEQMVQFGGSMWDTLFILVRDYDDTFINDFGNRIPCETCKNDFLSKVKRVKFNELKKDQIYICLWKIRCKIDCKKYGDKNNLTELKNYLKFLKLL